MIAPLALALALLAAPPAGAEEGARVERHPSPYGPVFVVDEGGERALRFGAPDAADQSVIVRAEPERAPVDYVRAAALAAAWPANPKHVVVVGMGAGVLSRALLTLLPSARVDSVELNPVVARLARTHFGLAPHPRHFVVVGDGAAYLRGVDDADVVVLDAYQGDDLPSTLTTPAFFAQVAGRLADDGVVALNLAVEDDALELALVARFDDAFPRCEAVRVAEGNLVLLGGPARDDAALAARVRALDVGGGVRWKLAPFFGARVPCAKVTPAPD